MSLSLTTYVIRGCLYLPTNTVYKSQLCRVNVPVALHYFIHTLPQFR